MASKCSVTRWGGTYQSLDAEEEELIVFSDAAADKLFLLRTHIYECTQSLTQ